jgi:uncharacterized protein
VSLVLDTGPILALLDADDPDHRRCVDLVHAARENLVVPAATLVEVDYWCCKLLGPEVFAAFVDDLALGAYQLLGLDADGHLRAVALERRYDDLRLGVRQDSASPADGVPPKVTVPRPRHTPLPRDYGFAQTRSCRHVT